MTNHTAPREGPTARRNYVLLLAMNTLYTGLCGMWIMFFPLYASQSLGLSKTALGLLYTASEVGILTGNLAGGVLADTLGRKKVLMASLSASALALASMLLPGRVPVYAGFPAYFLAVGLGSPAIHALALESSPRRIQGTLYMLAVRVAPSLPPLATLPLAGYLYEQGMYSLLLVIGVATLALQLLLATLLTETETVSVQAGEVSQPVHHVLRRVLRVGDKWLLLLVAAYGLDMLTSNGLEWYIPVYTWKRPGSRR
ncbi:MFS transporter [Pyrodictium delaneyi]|uniref:MFS transporter n=1 Tax=Pyrodictium delaneyi TaxID=1273541 RepID=UPI0015D85924|nr:MFS transporter [Pyrodictium delaneyi]